jgi:hypothetical protein
MSEEILHVARTPAETARAVALRMRALGQKWARETLRAFARKRPRFCVSGTGPL